MPNPLDRLPVQNRRQKYQVAGLYVAIALMAYALAGSMLNDIYMPGRRGRGVHVHYEALFPAAMALVLLATKSFLDSLGNVDRYKIIQKLLTAGIFVSFFFSLYYIAFPSGKRLATVDQCQFTFKKIGNFAADFSNEGEFASLMYERSSQCAKQPILKSYYQCVYRAVKPSDINSCQRESEVAFNRKNAS